MMKNTFLTSAEEAKRIRLFVSERDYLNTIRVLRTFKHYYKVIGCKVNDIAYMDYKRLGLRNAE